MGAYWSKKIGSDPYYASYERSFEHLKSETDRLKVGYGVLDDMQVHLQMMHTVKVLSSFAPSSCACVPQIVLHKRNNREKDIGNTIFLYGAVGFALAVIGAAWVRLSCPMCGACLQ